MTKEPFSRRRFLATALGLGALCAVCPPDASRAAVSSAEKEGLRTAGLPVLPPGAQTMEHYLAHCTGCQLCVTACPNNVLQTVSASPAVLQPTMVFENGCCPQECTVCTRVCPAGALSPLTSRARKRLQIGLAVFEPSLCRVRTAGADCTECARHCPTGAIVLAGRQGARMPVVDDFLCTGCGACVFHCPVRPAAMRIEGVREQTRL